MKAIIYSVLGVVLAASSAMACEDYSGDWVYKTTFENQPVKYRFRFQQEGCTKLDMANINADMTTEGIGIMTVPKLEQVANEQEGRRIVTVKHQYFNSNGNLVISTNEFITNADGTGQTHSRTQTWKLLPEQKAMTITTLEMTNGVDETNTIIMYRTR
jgi:hypothetical protein